MPSTFRTAAAVVFFSLFLGLCTVPAHAQPNAQTGGRGETRVFEEAWHWLTSLWASPGLPEPVQRALTILTNQSTSSDLSLNRGGVYDPNGHS